MQGLNRISTMRVAEAAIDAIEKLKRLNPYIYLGEIGEPSPRVDVTVKVTQGHSKWEAGEVIDAKHWFDPVEPRFLAEGI